MIDAHGKDQDCWVAFCRVMTSNPSQSWNDNLVMKLVEPFNAKLILPTYEKKIIEFNTLEDEVAFRLKFGK